MDFDIQNQDNTTQTPDQTVELSNFTEDFSAKAKQTVGFWEFFGLILLFAIPVIGFIACIVFMFSPKRESMKNYARAVFTWMAVRLVTTVAVLLLVLSILGGMLLPTINSSLNTNFGNIFEVIDVAGSLMSGNYAKAIGVLRPQLIDALGEEAEPLLEELSKSEYNKMFKQVANKDYEPLLEDFNEGKYQNLEEVLGKENFDSLKKEIESAVKGNPSEFLDDINQYLSIIG